MTHASSARQLTARTKTANRNGLRHDGGCGRPPRRSGLHRGPAVRPPETVVAMALASHAFKAGRPPGDRRDLAGSTPSCWERPCVDPARRAVHTLTRDDGLPSINTAVRALSRRHRGRARHIDETARARGATVVVPPARTCDRLWPRPAVARAGSNDPVGQDARPCRWKPQGPIVRAGWRTRASATRPHSEGLRARSPARQGSAVVLGLSVYD